VFSSFSFLKWESWSSVSEFENYLNIVNIREKQNIFEDISSCTNHIVFMWTGAFGIYCKLFFSFRSPHADYHVNSSMAETSTKTPLHVEKLTINTSLLAFYKLRNLTSAPSLPGQGFIYRLVAVQRRFFLNNIYYPFFQVKCVVSLS